MTRDASAARKPTGHLPDDVAGVPLADDALDPVDELDRLDATLEHGEQRPLAAFVHGVLAGDEADVGRHPGELHELLRLERCEQRDRADLLRRHHEGNRTRYGEWCGCGIPSMTIATSST
jgi:hypothetical protein